MPVEAEQKARIRDPEQLEAALAEHGPLRRSTYRDTYYDSADGSLVAADHELRVRVVETDEGSTALLTAKGDVVDTDSGSKRETETTVGDAVATRALLVQLGFREHIALTKHCANVELHAHGHDMLATLVHVPELDGTFIELETLVDDDADLTAALDAVHTTLADLGISADDHTSETYTGAVAAARS